LSGLKCLIFKKDFNTSMDLFKVKYNFWDCIAKNQITIKDSELKNNPIDIPILAGISNINNNKKLLYEKEVDYEKQLEYNFVYIDNDIILILERYHLSVIWNNVNSKQHIENQYYHFKFKKCDNTFMESSNEKILLNLKEKFKISESIQPSKCIPLHLSIVVDSFLGYHFDADKKDTFFFILTRAKDKKYLPCFSKNGFMYRSKLSTNINISYNHLSNIVYVFDVSHYKKSANESNNNNIDKKRSNGKIKYINHAVQLINLIICEYHLDNNHNPFMIANINNEIYVRGHTLGYYTYCSRFERKVSYIDKGNEDDWIHQSETQFKDIAAIFVTFHFDQLNKQPQIFSNGFFYDFDSSNDILYIQKHNDKSHCFSLEMPNIDSINNYYIPKDEDIKKFRSTEKIQWLTKNELLYIESCEFEFETAPLKKRKTEKGDSIEPEKNHTIYVFKFKYTWKVIRLFYIAFYKNKGNIDCKIAQLPLDIIKEITKFLNTIIQ
jgi:hypothetical protein